MAQPSAARPVPIGDSLAFMSTATAQKPTLITLPVSLYNEFGRWSLDSAGVGYEEKRQALMLHVMASRLKGGEGTTPMLLTGEQKLTDSTAIAEYADAAAAAGTHIYPQEPEARESEIFKWAGLWLAEAGAVFHPYDGLLGDLLALRDSLPATRSTPL